MRTSVLTSVPACALIISSRIDLYGSVHLPEGARVGGGMVEIETGAGGQNFLSVPTGYDYYLNSLVLKAAGSCNDFF